MKLIDTIARDLKLDEAYINKIVSHSSFYYRDFQIPKNNGGYRRIAQPSPELKTLQYWVVHNILSQFPVSKAACAYQKGSSIKKHAKIHSKSKYILHADITNFFPNIHFSSLEHIIRNNHVIRLSALDSLPLNMESVRFIAHQK